MGQEKQNRAFGQRNLFSTMPWLHFVSLLGFWTCMTFPKLNRRSWDQDSPLLNRLMHATTQNRTGQTSRTIVSSLLILETLKQRHRNTYLLIKRGGEFNSASQNIQIIWKVFKICKIWELTTRQGSCLSRLAFPIISDLNLAHLTQWDSEFVTHRISLEGHFVNVWSRF